MLQCMSLLLAHSDATPQDGRASLSAQSGNGAIIHSHAPLPAALDHRGANNACFIVRDATGQALAYFYDAFLQLSHTIGPHFETLDRLGRKPPISDGGNPSGR